ncbi:16S rRNA (cytosine(1402)-N(4))-methyltransferase RsmH [Amaricoccus macauensis]|uniref:16S rRNA (cytosine(1402)-N(4))-methyltransferase RsmH n=1 Tax=Amaricoccus macauensis TaxID=57001 RepID=UPI003C7CC688
MHTPVTPHIPVLLESLIQAVSPVSGVWLDGTLGAGGYTRALLEAGAAHVIGVDRDPEALRRADDWKPGYGDAITVREGRFGELDLIAREAGFEKLDGVVLDIGVSSMQIDQDDRGFSFQKEGPLDMRMEQSGTSAADLVNTLPEAELADILFQLGEERASRRIAKAIVKERATTPFETTLQLAAIIEKCLPRPKPGQPHPATRSFQALRIAVNNELGELANGLTAAENALAPGGWLAVVTFHSLEDRIVKRYIQASSGSNPRGNRHAPEGGPVDEPRFERTTRNAIAPSASETAANPRARSAKLRVARRLDAPALPVEPAELGLPPVVLHGMRQ